MPTTLRSTKLAVEHEREGSPTLLALACAVVLLLAAAAIFTLPAVGNIDVNETWLMGP